MGGGATNQLEYHKNLTTNWTLHPTAVLGNYSSFRILFTISIIFFNKRPMWATVAHLCTMNALKIWHQNGTKNKYNNAKRSIPAHPTFVNDAHRGLHLWPVTSKINRDHPLTMVNMSAKFDEEAHNGLVSIVFTSLFPCISIVTLTFDLWPPKSIGFILSLWLTCLPSLMKKHTTA